MPVGFGFSVGDFIAALKLVQDAVQALESTRGASASYHALMHELYALESALLRVKDTELEPELESEKRALLQTASLCQGMINGFLANIQAFHPHLRAGGSGNSTWSRTRDACMKIKWSLCKEEDVERFKDGNSTIQAKKAAQDRGRMAARVENVSTALLTTVSSISSGILSCLQLGRKQLEATTKILGTNIQIFNKLGEIHKSLLQLPYQVLRDQPVYLINVFGHRTQFHLDFIRSREALLAVLRVDFEAAGVGTEKIDKGHVAFEDEASRRDIDITRNWNYCFHPGQRVSMSVILELTPEDLTNTCPSCHKEQTASLDEEVECDKCYFVFKRLSEADPREEHFPSPEITAGLSRSDSSSSTPHTSAPVNPWSSAFESPLPPNPFTNTASEIGPFRRVRLQPFDRVYGCKLWVFGMNSIVATMLGVGKLYMRNLENSPTLQLVGDIEGYAEDILLLSEPLTSGKDASVWFQRIDSQRIAILGNLKYKLFRNRPLAFALEFDNIGRCDTIWSMVSRIQSNMDPERAVEILKGLKKDQQTWSIRFSGGSPLERGLKLARLRGIKPGTRLRRKNPNRGHMTSPRSDD